MPIDFDQDERGLQLYRNVKSDIAAESARLTESLPIFVRIVITEGGGGTRWLEFNKFDLLNPVTVPPDFPALGAVFGDWSAATTFDTELLSDEKALTVENFLATKIIGNQHENYSVQDLIAAVAYNRGLHNKPDEPRLQTLYDHFVKEVPRRAESILREVAKAIVNAYALVYEQFSSTHGNLVQRVKGRQPRIVTAGKIEIDGAIFENSYLQVPMPLQPDDGCRLSLRLKLLSKDGHGGCIAAVGHRTQPGLCLIVKHSGNRLIVEAMEVGNVALPTAAKSSLEVTDEMLVRHFTFEIAYYARGHLVVAINEWTKDHQSISHAPALRTGKLVLGSNLDGEGGASFQLDAALLERLVRYRTSSLSYSSDLRPLPPYAQSYLPHSAIRRPNLLHGA